MSMYNMMMGMNSTVVVLVLPVLGKHMTEYPRFRDAFMGGAEENEGKLVVYTRTGGGNREDYADEIEMMRNMETFVRDYDDDWDCTYANWVFDIPEKWKADVENLVSGNIDQVSQEYVDMLCDINTAALEPEIRNLFRS